MNPVQTGIAVALALVVIAVFFIFPGLSPFGSPTAPAVATSTAQVSNDQTTNPMQMSSTSMPQGNVTQLQVTDETVGTGATAAAGDSVTVNYVGMLTDGTVFDASANHGSTGFTFTLGAGQVIPGWDQGVAGMKEGGKRELVIPASLAYGASGITDPSTGKVIIPPNATLVFEVELVKVAPVAQ
jgi:FKBP-type peptidyl-prolyl cis-trans isomerase